MSFGRLHNEWYADQLNEEEDASQKREGIWHPVQKFGLSEIAEADVLVWDVVWNEVAWVNEHRLDGNEHEGGEP